MDHTLLFAFWGLTTLLICTPGADWAYLITAGLRGRGVHAVLGMMAGHFGIALAVAAGLAALVATHAWMLVVISVVGGLYLMRLGTSALQSVRKDRTSVAEGRGGTDRSSAGERGVDERHRSAVTGPGAVAVAQRTRRAPARRSVALQGMSVTLLNPKVYLMFLALLPQFVSDSAPFTDTAQMLVLGIVHVLTCGLIYLAVSLGAGAVLTSRPRAATVVSAVSGIVMIVLGVVVIVDVIV